jgi:uncharacterized protein (UPF0335 family)
MIKVNIILSEINNYKNKLTEFEKEHTKIEKNIKTIYFESNNDCFNYCNIINELNKNSNKYKKALEFNAKLKLRKDKLNEIIEK